MMGKIGSKQKPNSSGEQGQSLVELIVAVGLIVTAITALLSLSVISLRGTSFGVSKSRAIKWAGEEIELVRAYRDSLTWSAFASGATSGVSNCGGPACTLGCHIGSAVSRVSGAEALGDGFSRCFVAEPFDGNPFGSSDKIKITAKVTWADQKGEQEVTLISVFTNWR